MKLKPILTAFAVAVAAIAQPALAGFQFTQNEKGEVTHYNGIPLPPIQTVEEAKAQAQREIAAAKKAREAQQAEPATRHSSPATLPQQVFFTGKPYLEETGQYLFLFRHYDPELARWTTADPSGFPDGANNLFYSPCPTFEIDSFGLLKLNLATNTNQTIVASHGGNQITFEVWTCKTNDDQFTINLYKYVSGAPAGTDYTFNCHGYVFGNSQYWIDSPDVANILKGDGYKKLSGNDHSQAKIAVWTTNGGHFATVTGLSGQTVTEVTGKAGAVPGLSITSPSVQWSGTPTYYE